MLYFLNLVVMGKSSKICPICGKEVTATLFPRHVWKCKLGQKKDTYLKVGTPRGRSREKGQEFPAQRASDRARRAFPKKSAERVNHIKDIRSELIAYAQDVILARYRLGEKEIMQSADALTRRLGMPQLPEIVEKGPPEDPVEKAIAKTNLALFFDALAVDQVLPGHARPLFSKIVSARTPPLSPLEQEIVQALINSEYSAYEVIRVKKDRKANQTKWCRLRSLFTGKIYDYSDAALVGQFRAWDILIGRLHAVRGVNLLTTMAFIINARNAPVFNRLLLYYWIAWERKINSVPVQNLAEMFPRPFQEFGTFQATLTSPQLYNERVQAFLKADCPVIREIYDALAQVNSKRPRVTGTPEGYEPKLCSARGTLQEGSGPTIFQLLKGDTRHFREGKPQIKETHVPETFTFEFLARTPPTPKLGFQSQETPPTSSFEELATLSVEEYKAHLSEAMPEVAAIEFSPEHWPMINTPLENRALLPAIVGFVDVDQEHIRLSADSEEAFSRLNELVRVTFGNLLLDLKKNLATDLAASAGQIQAQTRDILSSWENLLDKFPESSREHLSDAMYQVMRWAANVETGEARAKNHLEWIERPHPLLQFKSPREARADPALRPRLIEIVKQLENLEDSVGVLDPAHSYWALLDFGDDWS